MSEIQAPEKKIFGWGKYEFTILWWSFLIWGLIFLDRLVMPYTAPAVMADLQITEVQYGLINAFTTGAYALSAIFLTGLLERTGQRKKWLIILAIGAGAFACLGAATQDVWQLLATRAFVGLCEGPIAPLIFAMLLRESSSKRVAVNSGIVNMGVSVIASLIGAPLVTHIAAAASWRLSFLVPGILSIIVALLMMRFIKEKEYLKAEPTESLFATFLKMMKYRNVLISFVLGILTMCVYWTMQLYAVRFFVEIVGHPLINAGYFVAIHGAVSIVWTVLVPKISDFIGRKPALILWFIVVACTPFIMYNAPLSFAAVLFYSCFLMTGSIIPYFQAIIPSETLPNYMLGTASGLILGVSEIVGGSAWPAVAGNIATSNGIPTVILVAGFAAVAAAVISLFVKETRGMKDAVQNITL